MFDPNVLPPGFDTYIIIKGQKHKEIAKAIADYCNTKHYDFEDESVVATNDEVEDRFTMSEEKFTQALEELNSILGFTIQEEDIEF